MDTRINVKDATKKMQSEFLHLSGRELEKATANAINYALARTRTRVNKDVRTVFNITSNDVRDDTKIEKARASSRKLHGEIMANSRPLNLSRFNPQQRNNGVLTRKVGGRIKGNFASKKENAWADTGVTIEIYKGKTETIKSAFLLFFGNGNAAVMARGHNSRGVFTFSKPRLPIDGITSKSVLTAIINDQVEAKYSAYTQEVYGQRLIHEMQEGIKHWK